MRGQWVGGAILITFSALAADGVPPAQGGSAGQINSENAWIDKGRAALNDANDNVMRLLKDAQEQQNLRDMDAGLKLLDKIKLADAYFEHAVTIDSYVEALKLDPGSPTFWAAARCINFEIDAEALKRNLNGAQKRGEYRGYDVALADLELTLPLAVDVCARVTKKRPQT